MKTNQKNNFFKKKMSSGPSRNRNTVEKIKDRNDDELMVIRDPYCKKDYYLSVIDTFTLEKREYLVAYNYAPDDGSHDAPEMVIMRTEFAATGEQYFYSIKDSLELEKAFVYFMRRYYGSAAPGRQSRSGVNPDTLS